MQHRVEIGSRGGGLLVKHGHRLGLGQGRLSSGGRGVIAGFCGRCALLYRGARHVCLTHEGVAKELKLLSLQLGQG